MTEAQLIEGCKQKSELAREALYRRFCPPMRGVCYRYVGNREDAEDMLQEGFLKVFSHIDQYRQEGALEGWIRRVMVHTCINFLKRKKKLSEIVDILHAQTVYSVEPSAPSIMHAKQIVECIGLLPTGYRTVLNLYAIEGYAHREIAGMLDIEEGTSRSQYARARIMLQHILVKKGIIPNTLQWSGTAAPALTK
jgi:RNA polymerase sigma-70 factor (ECF subfamily)